MGKPRRIISRFPEGDAIMRTSTLPLVTTLLLALRAWAAVLPEQHTSLEASDNVEQKSQVYLVGLQKSGTTVIAAAMAAGRRDSSSLEAANSCCCAGSCPHNSRPDCVNSTQLTAPLFDNSAEQYYSWCAKEMRSGVAKADDMIWQISGLMDFTAALPAGSLGYRTQYVYIVRHPIFTVRSLLDWCINKEDQTCDEHI